MKTFAIGDRITLDTRETVEVSAKLPCGSFNRRDTLYSFSNGLTLTGREIELNTTRQWERQ